MQDTKKKTSSNKPIGESNFSSYAYGLDDEQIKFITDSVLEF
jgi:hypothetical protein